MVLLPNINFLISKQNKTLKIDWRLKRLKNTIDLFLFYRKHVYGFSESDLWKCWKKNIFISQQTYLYRSQTDWSFMKFYFVHILKVYFVIKKQSLCLGDFFFNFFLVYGSADAFFQNRKIHIFYRLYFYFVPRRYDTCFFNFKTRNPRTASICFLYINR